jgi:hypothetical protein
MLPQHTNNLLFSIFRNVAFLSKLLLIKPVVKEMQDAEPFVLVFETLLGTAWPLTFRSEVFTRLILESPRLNAF